MIIYIARDKHGSDWYRQPGTKDQPLATIWEAYERVPDQWPGEMQVVFITVRHRRRAERRRRRATAARRKLSLTTPNRKIP